MVDLSAKFSESLGEITVVDLESGAIAPRLLIKTGSLAGLDQDSRSDPGPGARSGEWMQSRGVILLGLDLPSVDAIDSKDLRNHHALAAADIAIVEGLDLSQAEAGLYSMAALPLKIMGGDGAPGSRRSLAGGVNVTGDWLAQPRTRWAALGVIVSFFAITNLPWTLDDYDQAKQAYTSFEMVGQGHWLYQHTPNESVATKPPLVGWLSAGLFQVTRWWEGAWRLPSLAAALALLWLLATEATAAYGAVGGLIALSAFGLNLLSPRLATLVRTDMPLALVTFLIGGQIWRKIRSGGAWTWRDQMIAFVLLTSAMLIKGPIIYAFILPGLIVYQFLRRKRSAPSGWSGSWPWVLSLAIFLAWAVGGIMTRAGFL